MQAFLLLVAELSKWMRENETNPDLVSVSWSMLRDKAKSPASSVPENSHSLSKNLPSCRIELDGGTLW